jgi:hypothetical protein
MVKRPDDPFSNTLHPFHKSLETESSSISHPGSPLGDLTYVNYISSSVTLLSTDAPDRPIEVHITQ